jgi:GlpG protein
MRQPPRIQTIVNYPVTGGICLLALVVYIAGLAGRINAADLVEDYRLWHGEPWRLITCTLPHANLFHLAFNLYWVWAFGTLVEEILGSGFIALLVVMLAVGSSAAEYAFTQGGEGLSGVGYGLFGFLWAIGRYDARFKGIIDAKTIQLFVVWFFICIALTVSNAMPIGNIAHGSGAVLGAIAGYAVARHGAPRTIAAISLAGTVVMLLICSSVLRPKVNFSRNGGWDVGNAGYEAIKDGNYDLAFEYLAEATAYRSADDTSWFNLGIVQQHLGRPTDALNSYRHALAIDPNSTDYQEAVKSLTP